MAVFHLAEGALEIQQGHEVLRVEPWGTDSARVRAARYRVPAESIGALDERPPPADGTVSVSAGESSGVLVHGELTVSAVHHGGQVRLNYTRTSTGEELLSEQSRDWQGNRTGVYEARQRFAAVPRGAAVRPRPAHPRQARPQGPPDLVQRNGEVSIPFVLSSRGYGLLWRTCPRWAPWSSPRTAPAGRPPGPARSTTGSPPPPPRRRSWPGTPTPPATPPNCPSGPVASGSASCATVLHGGDPDDPGYRELMIRWFQYGAFCPLFRLHGDREPRTPWGHAQTGGPNEVRSHGEEAYEILTAHLHLRERLRPYIHDQMRTASEGGTPPMRPLFVDFPHDQAAWTVCDQFMFGPDLLVAPVTTPGATERQVHLPEGVTWTDAWTGREHPGGATITAHAPIERIPVFVAQGADVLRLFTPAESAHR